MKEFWKNVLRKPVNMDSCTANNNSPILTPMDSPLQDSFVENPFATGTAPILRMLKDPQFEVITDSLQKVSSDLTAKAVSSESQELIDSVKELTRVLKDFVLETKQLRETVGSLETRQMQIINNQVSQSQLINSMAVHNSVQNQQKLFGVDSFHYSMIQPHYSKVSSTMNTMPPTTSSSSLNCHSNRYSNVIESSLIHRSASTVNLCSQKNENFIQKLTLPRSSTTPLLSRSSKSCQFQGQKKYKISPAHQGLTSMATTADSPDFHSNQLLEQQTHSPSQSCLKPYSQSTQEINYSSKSVMPRSFSVGQSTLGSERIASPGTHPRLFQSAENLMISSSQLDEDLNIKLKTLDDLGYKNRTFNRVLLKMNENDLELVIENLKTYYRKRDNNLD